MSTNPRSLAYDEKGQQLVCGICVEWTPFDDLYMDASGTPWDICKPCGEAEEQARGSKTP